MSETWPPLSLDGVGVEVGKRRLFLSWGFQSFSLYTGLPSLSRPPEPPGSDRKQEGGSPTHTPATQPQGSQLQRKGWVDTGVESALDLVTETIGFHSTSFVTKSSHSTPLRPERGRGEPASIPRGGVGAGGSGAPGEPLKDGVFIPSLVGPPRASSALISTWI